MIADHGVRSDRLDDVFKVLLAQIDELSLDLASDGIVRRRRDTDTPGFCDALKPCRDVYAIAKDIMRLNNHVADIDANTEGDAPIFRAIGVSVPMGSPSLGFSPPRG